MIYYSDLPRSLKNKRDDEPFDEFKVRYNIMIDLLNGQDPDIKYHYLKIK